MARRSKGNLTSAVSWKPNEEPSLRERGSHYVSNSADRLNKMRKEN